MDGNIRAVLLGNLEFETILPYIGQQPQYTWDNQNYQNAKHKDHLMQLFIW